MNRFLLPVLAAVSVLFAIAIGILWYRSHHGTDYLQHTSLPTLGINNLSISYTLHGISIIRGQLRIYASESTYFPHEPIASLPNASAAWHTGRLGLGHFGSDPLPIRSIWNRLGFNSYETGMMSSFSSDSEHGIAIPLWLPLVLSLFFPVLLLRRICRQRHRRAHGFCPDCGYDLRATPHRCPECGRQVSTPAAPGPLP